LRANPFRTLLWCLLAIGAEAALAAPVGIVQRASGDTWIYSRTERARHLNAGDAFESGVSISTDPKSSVVLRFDDGQIVVLASNATFRVKNFAFSPAQPDKGQLLFELVKGGMRCVTGSIGEKNRSGWLLQTPGAMVGIGGTDFFAVVEQGLYAHVNTGAVTLSNDAGAATIAAGGNGYVAGDAAVPAATTTVPDGLFAELQALGPGVSAGASSPGSGTAAAPATVTSMAGIGIAVGAIGAAIAAAAGGSQSSTTHH
jgi:hypothetical protein